ncbi:hypothetical protein GCM10010466_05570 [Planomonospora alba]|uniref:Uncharacterized protein n=1 Tax=Planomonospora alba TaxID=161354 RepID=A0ABP6MMB2_9ACTN
MAETAPGSAPGTGGADGPADHADRSPGPPQPSGAGAAGGGPPGRPADLAAHGGRASSWLAVTVSVLGFAIGGVGLTGGPDWFVFWLGVIVCALGGILLMAFGAFADVVLDAPRTRADHHEGILG